MLETALQLLVWRWQSSMLESAQLSLSARVLNSMKEISKLLNLGGRVRRDPGTRPVPNFFSSTRPVQTQKLKSILKATKNEKSS